MSDGAAGSQGALRLFSDPLEALPPAAVAPGITVVGSKTASGAAERILAELPPHEVFIELFAGGAGLTRRKRPCELTLLFEREPHQVRRLQRHFAGRSDVQIVLADSLSVLLPTRLPQGAVIYADPPYPLSTRRNRRYYVHDWADAEHERFLTWAAAVTVPMLISCYACQQYDRALSAWRRSEYFYMSRGGRRCEQLWCNFPPAQRRAEPHLAGEDYRARQRIKRKVARWRRRFLSCGPAERAAIMQALLAAE